MADNKQQAIDDAKDAALGSVSFAIYGTKADADSLKKSSVLAARNVVAVRKSVALVASRLQTFQTILVNIKAALGKKGDPTSKLNAVNAALNAGGNAYAQAEADQEAKTETAAGLSMTGSVGVGRGLSLTAIAGLAMAIPFLLSPEVREMITGFFNGFLSGLGLSTEAVDKAKTFLLIAAGVVGGIFALKALGTVVETFMAMKRLAEVMGLLGMVTNDEKTKVEKERAKIEKEKKDTADGAKKAKDEVKDNKDEIKKAKKAGKGSRTKAGKIYDRLGALFDKVLPKLKKMVPNILKAIPIVGSVIGIGLILYDLFSIGSDIYDAIFGDDDKEEEEQKTEQQQAPTPAASTPAAPAPAASSTSEPEQKPAAAGTPSPPAPSSGGGGSATPAASPASSPTAVPATAPTVGTQVAASSVAVQQTETDIAQKPNVTIAVIDNSTTAMVIPRESKSPASGAGASYSVTVGA